MWRTVVEPIVRIIWPRTLEVPKVEDIPEEERMRVARDEELLRRELIRAETEAQRLLQRYRADRTN